ncbi:MAG: proliferating cell nuclear antigen (pcna) [Thermoprotei archaeon]
MRVVHSDVRDIRAIVDALTKLVDEALLVFKPEGVELITVDRAHIALIKISIPSSAFQEYDVSEEFKFGFNAAMLSKLLKAASRKESLVLESSSPDVVTVKLVGGVERVYQVKNLEVIPPEVPELNLSFDVVATVSSAGIKKAVSEAKVVSDTVNVTADENSVKFYTEGESKVEVVLDKDTGGLIEIQVNKPSTAAYDVAYINDVMGLSRLGDTVNLAFSENKPLQLEFGTETSGKVTYLLAPKLA